MINADSPCFVEILLLEDEPSDAYLVKMALKEGRILAHLHHVVDGREGLDFLNKTGESQILIWRK